MNKMKFLKEVEAISFDDVCISPNYSDLDSRSDADVSFYPYKNPIINSPMINTSSKNMIKFMVDNEMLCTVHRYFKSADDQLRWVKDSIGPDFTKVFYAVGKNKEWIKTLVDFGVTNFCCDFAHGWSKVCIESIKYIREICPNAVIMAGNVACGDAYADLVNAGADLVRVGIASGSICSTAKSTAIGVPIITSIISCKKAQDTIGGLIICDGGVRSSSDMLKAIACGADMIMVGKFLAATSEAEGPFYDVDMKICEVEYSKFVCYMGMASTKARAHNGTHQTSKSVEGVSGQIKYTGRTEDVINSTEHNLRSGMAYVGARTWREFNSKVKLQKMSTSGIIEKETHLIKTD